VFLPAKQKWLPTTRNCKDLCVFFDFPGGDGAIDCETVEDRTAVCHSDRPNRMAVGRALGQCFDVVGQLQKHRHTFIVDGVGRKRLFREL
jgi:hypothetical protein